MNVRENCVPYDGTLRTAIGPLPSRSYTATPLPSVVDVASWLLGSRRLIVVTGCEVDDVGTVDVAAVVVVLSGSDCDMRTPHPTRAPVDV